MINTTIGAKKNTPPRTVVCTKRASVFIDAFSFRNGWGGNHENVEVAAIEAGANGFFRKRSIAADLFPHHRRRACAKHTVIPCVLQPAARSAAPFVLVALVARFWLPIAN
jgi:hypothetical protein